MAASNVNIRMDSELKAQLQELVANLGLDLTSFFTMAAKQAVRDQELPFHPNMRFNQETWQARWEVEFMEAHPEIPWKTYDDVDAMFEEVLAEDEV